MARKNITDMANYVRKTKFEQAVDHLQDAIDNMVPSKAERNEWEFEDRENCVKRIRKFLKEYGKTK